MQEFGAYFKAKALEQRAVVCAVTTLPYRLNNLRALLIFGSLRGSVSEAPGAFLNIRSFRGDSGNKVLEQ